MTLSPFTALGDTANKITNNLGPFANQFLGDHQYAGNKMRPDVLRVIKNPAAAVEFSFSRMRFTYEIGIDCFGRQRAGHVRWRQFHEPDFIRLYSLILH